MPKRTKKTTLSCDQHLFLLKPKHNSCRFTQTVTLSFCDPNQDKSKLKHKKYRNCPHIDCPIFNNDKNFATPTFILNSEKTHYQQRGDKMRQEHQKKMLEYTDEKDSLNVPKPRTRNNFCSVCRQVYDDYLDHIESDNHKKKINNSRFNQYILESAQKFNPNLKNNSPFAYNNQSTGDQDDVEIIETGPIKKVKTDYEMNERQFYPYEMLKQQILPPPHLNLNNSAYFPGLGQGMNYLGNGQIGPYQMGPMGQMPFNYGMSMFMNPFFAPNGYGMMQPWMECFGMGGLGHLEKMEQNYMMGNAGNGGNISNIGNIGNMGNMGHRVRTGFGQRVGYQGMPYSYTPIQQRAPELKRVMRQQVIVIDDDESEKRERAPIYV